MKNIQLEVLTRQLIADNKLNEAISTLLIFIRENQIANQDYLNNIIHLSSRYNSIKKRSLGGTINNSDTDIEFNRITNATLHLISELEKAIPSEQRLVLQKEDLPTSNNMPLSINAPSTKNKNQSIEEMLSNGRKIKILFLTSNPSDTGRLGLDQEIRDIEEELTNSEYKDSFELIKISAVRVKDLQNALLKHSPNIVHFSGHGDTKGIALLDNHTGRTQIVGSEPLSNLFKLFSDNIICVFLNSCNSKKQAQLIRTHIPHVIGTNRSFYDKTAI